uniref:endo-polygalacturonase n=1 Tax=Rhodotorula toruloides TaxID=5286 RepID=A0A0K3CL33_RHOTO
MPPAGSPPPASAEPPLVPSHWRHLASSSPLSRRTSYTAPAANFRTYHDPRHPGIVWEWSTRGHRKGIPPRPLRVREQQDRDEEKYAGLAGEPEKEWKIEERKAKNLWAFVRRTRWWGWDVHDISWWVAFLFTLGSVWWCIQGIMVFCYSSNTSTAFTDTESAMAFLGGTTFLFGSYLGWVESFNPACSGSEDDNSGLTDDGAKQAASGSDGKGERNVEKGASDAAPASRRKSWSTMGWEAKEDLQYVGPPTSDTTFAPSSPSSTSKRPPWRWFLFTPPPASSPIFLGYIANTVQLFGAIAFEVSVICGLPGVLPASGAEGGPDQQGAPERDWVAAYWASLVFALETQKRWWKIRPLNIGWNVGFWNVVGGFGFWFSGIFGIWRQTDISDPEHYQYWGTAFSTFWGSWAFLLGSSTFAPQLSFQPRLKIAPFSLALAAFSVLRCTGTIASLDDVAAAEKCATVNIKSFTVPAGKTFELDLVDNAVVNVRESSESSLSPPSLTLKVAVGDIKFGTKQWEGPLVQVSGKNVHFNGNGHKWDGQGSYYWDGKGGNGGKTKPKFFKVKFSGAMDSVYLLNQPVQGFSISNPAKLVMSNIVVDVKAGASLGHNTDAFDISSAKDLTIDGAAVNNQDDCVAINDGTGITIQNSVCTGGHGISVGSIRTGKHVSNVVIKCVIVDNDNGLRIKTYVGATDASVSNVQYIGNTVTNAKKYGVVIEQDYTNDGATGKATNGVPINGVYFTGTTNNVSVGWKAQRVYVLCASGSCSNFDFTALKTSGGSAGSIEGTTVKGYSL